MSDNNFNKQQKNSRNTSMDVARLVGVSQATVSRAFDPSSKMKSTTREKVLNAALSLNYTPDAIARSLISNNTNIIAVIMQNATNPFYAKVLTKLSIQLRKFGKQILYFYLDNPDNLQQMITQVLQYRVDGILITSINLSSTIADTCLNFGIPVVLFNRQINSSKIQSVCCDNFQAGCDCADYFVMKGHRRLAFIGGYDTASTTLKRKEGFLSRLRERGITDVTIYHSDYTYEAGISAFHHLAKEQDLLPDAIFCISDLVCAGVIDCIRHNYHLSIPDDIAVVGFDDIDLASYQSYDITSFSQPIDDMISYTCELLMSSEKYSQESNLTLFPCTLITRTTA